MPALVKSRVGSSSGTREELGRMACPFWRKKSKKEERISEPFTAEKL
jgi:hypothetical protein